jgi:WhiB family transcriptional regulator, redox-sensing transcriptional regulator
VSDASSSNSNTLAPNTIDLDLPCSSQDPELFFAEKPMLVEQAKAVCTDCPVRRECLTAALSRAEPYGVWGGQLVILGTVVPRKIPRGRPRRVAA